MQEFNEISHRSSPTSAASALLLPNSSFSAAHYRIRTTATGTSSDSVYLVIVDQEKQQLHDANLTNQNSDKVFSPVTQTKSSN
jgi:hypothetical protein